MRLANEVLVVVFASVLVGALTDQWLMAGSLPVLWAIWKFLRLEGGPPVLAFAMTYHWGQNVVGLFYYSLTCRRPLGMHAELYSQMVIISLVCVCLIVAGIVMGDAAMARMVKPRPTREIALSWSSLLVFYFALLVFRGTLRDYAWNISAGLTQG